MLDIRKEYKLLLDIQQKNITCYQEGSDLKLDARELEIKNDVLKAKNYQSTLEKITQEFDAVKKENALLRKQKKKTRTKR